MKVDYNWWGVKLIAEDDRDRLYLRSIFSMTYTEDVKELRKFITIESGSVKFERYGNLDCWVTKESQKEHTVGELFDFPESINISFNSEDGEEII